MAFVLAVGCQDEGPKTNVGAVSDASFGDAPVRGVTGELPDGLDNFADALDGVRGIGTTPLSGSDAIYDRAPNRPDAAPDPMDAAGSSGCSLVQQDCTAGRACYPGPTGRGVCYPPGGFVEGMPCEEHLECAAGLLCVEVFGGAGRLCEPICDPTAVVPCRDNRSCRAFPASLVGTCAP